MSLPGASSGVGRPRWAVLMQRIWQPHVVSCCLCLSSIGKALFSSKTDPLGIPSTHHRTFFSIPLKDELRDINVEGVLPPTARRPRDRGDRAPSDGQDLSGIDRTPTPVMTESGPNSSHVLHVHGHGHVTERKHIKRHTV